MESGEMAGRSSEPDGEQGDTGANSEEALETRAEGLVEEQQENEVTDEIDELRQEVEEWHLKADDWLDKYQRSVAAFSNYRKRQERERQQQVLRLTMDLLRQLLPVVDDFERGLERIPVELADDGWVEGVLLIHRKLKDLLAGFQVAPIEAQGELFDPNLHSALMQEESDEYPEGTVTEELQKGYLLGDQVLRPSLVKVSSGPASKEDAGP